MSKKILLALILVFNSLILFAQDVENEVEMADVMRSNGKIYIVVAVVAVIFTGIVVYLISLDRKITDIEKRINKG
ncbi:MAG: CcmD family protein [Bacteroidota bacterium]